MTLPPAAFAAVAPPPDGLALAFTAARSRRNSKAAVSAFGGAVAIASVLSFLAPPGQSLVQEPAQPARGGLLPGLSDEPRHGAPAPLVRTPVTHRPAVVAPATSQVRQPARAGRGRVTTATVQPPACDPSRIACLFVQTPAPNGPTMRATVCQSAASITVEYDAPQVGPTRTSISQTVAVGSCPD